MKYFPPINGDQGNPDRPYINANPAGGIEGSWPHGKAIEAPQREILSVITAAGIVPNADDNTQLYEAILALLSANIAPDATTTNKGVVELATGPEALGGSDATRAVTSAGLASAKSLAAAGYYKFPGGLILQWGNGVTAAPGNVTITWPIAFTTACLGAVGAVTGRTTNSGTTDVSTGTQTTTNGFFQMGSSTSGITFFYIAIGY